MSEESDFPLQNIPFGIYHMEGSGLRACSRIGNTIIDLCELSKAGLLDPTCQELFSQSTLNAFFAKGRIFVGEIRQQIIALFEASNATLRDDEALRKQCLYDLEAVTLAMPVKVENYTDFYSSIEHATNVGTMFRGADNALMPNWKHIPVGYHGRASSIVVSGVPIHRPCGQTKADDAPAPEFGPSRLLDFELEMAFITCKENGLGNPVPIAEAEDYIIGMVLFNDWSARDIQKWEYVPLGPFLAKNFASSISPWVVTLDALEPFRLPGPVQDPPVLPYLQSSGNKNFDIRLEVDIIPESGHGKTVSRSNFKYMYWNMCQQLAHHTVNGCNIKVGDMYGSGTISGPEPDMFGSMLELTWRGTKPIEMPDGNTRKFIDDGDTVVMRGFCRNDHYRIGFGEVRTKVLPAKC